MKINFHDLNAQYREYQSEINAAIQSVLDSGQFIMGDAVGELETALSSYLSCRHILTCANGTDALLLALMSIGVSAGDEVITTPFTFIATAEVITLLGAKPVFVDIDETTYNINPSKIAAKMTEKTRAIIPVSLYGQPADMDEINQLSREYSHQFDKKIYVIEDAAQSFGAEYKGKKSSNLSDMGCLSFFPTKPLGCYGDGGAIVINDDLLAEKIKALRVHGQTKRYYHQYIGINSRLDTLQAAILNVKLNYFDNELMMRAQIAKRYDALLSQLDVIKPSIKSDRTSVYAQYSIRVSQRERVIDYLKSKQIPTAIHYPQPLHLQAAFNYLGYHQGDLPIAEKVALEIMSLPMSAFIAEEEQQQVVSALEEALQPTFSTQKVI